MFLLFNCCLSVSGLSYVWGKTTTWITKDSIWISHVVIGCPFSVFFNKRRRMCDKEFRTIFYKFWIRKKVLDYFSEVHGSAQVFAYQKRRYSEGNFITS